LQERLVEFVRNEVRHDSIMEIPSPIFFPALWVLFDQDYDQAMKILEGSALSLPRDGASPDPVAASTPGTDEAVPSKRSEDLPADSPLC